MSDNTFFFGMPVVIVPTMPKDDFLLVGPPTWRDGLLRQQVVGVLNGREVNAWDMCRGTSQRREK